MFTQFECENCDRIHTRKRPNKKSRFTNTNEKITRGNFVILKAEGVVAEDMFHRNNLVDPNKI